MPNDREGTERSWMMNLLAALSSKKFYGKVTLILEDGRVKRVVKEESIMPPVG